MYLKMHRAGLRRMELFKRSANSVATWRLKSRAGSFTPKKRWYPIDLIQAEQLKITQLQCKFPLMWCRKTSNCWVSLSNMRFFWMVGTSWSPSRTLLDAGSCRWCIGGPGLFSSITSLETAEWHSALGWKSLRCLERGASWSSTGPEAAGSACCFDEWQARRKWTLWDL